MSQSIVWPNPASTAPVGGATAANQVLEIADLDAIKASAASIDTKTPALGQAVAGASVPVVLPAAQITALTPPTTVTVTQATGTNLHTVVDSLPSIPAGANAIGSVSVSNFPGTQPVSGTVAVSSLPAIPAGSNAIGSITNTSFAATQATAANLNATVVGTGTFATQVTSLPSIPAGSNAIGSITNTSFIATQATAANLNATVAQGAAGAAAWKVDGSAVTQPVSGTIIASTPAGTVTDRSGTCSATPLTATTLAAVNASRKYLFIENNSTLGDIYINFTTSATATNSIVLKPFASYEMNGNFVSTELISVASNVASATYSAKEG